MKTTTQPLKVSKRAATTTYPEQGVAVPNTRAQKSRTQSLKALATAPANEGAKVKLDLFSRNNDNLLTFATQHEQDMVGNPLYPNPMPAVVDFDGLLADYSAKLTDMMSARTAATASSRGFSASRDALMEALNTRGNYVQLTSNSNAEAILSSGFDVRAARTPAAPLSPPASLAVDLNGTSGVMNLSWAADPNASGYLVQYSEDVTPRVWQVQPRVTKAKLTLNGMTVGTTYVFQAAALGGATGQSDWSAETSRAAA